MSHTMCTILCSFTLSVLISVIDLQVYQYAQSRKRYKKLPPSSLFWCVCFLHQLLKKFSNFKKSENGSQGGPSLLVYAKVDKKQLRMMHIFITRMLFSDTKYLSQHRSTQQQSSHSIQQSNIDSLGKLCLQRKRQITQSSNCSMTSSLVAAQHVRSMTGGEAESGFSSQVSSCCLECATNTNTTRCCCCYLLLK